MGEPRNTDGRFSPEYTDEEILAATRAHEPAATSEVAEEVGMTRQGADRRLRRLRDAGRVSSKKIGASLVWFAPDPDRREPTDAARADAVDDATDAPADPPTDAHAGHATPEESDTPDRIGDALDGWEPDTQANPRTARAQTRRTAEYLRSVGEYRQRSELVDALADDSTLGGRSWWERAVRPGLGRLADRDLVEYTHNRGWRWIGHVDRDGPEREGSAE